MISTGHVFYFVTSLILIFNYGDMAVPSQRIFGGYLTKPGEIPYVVSYRVNGKHRCGGAIISEKHILTSATCVYYVKPPYSNAKVVTGTISLRRGGETHNIKAISVHPIFTKKRRSGLVRYDIGVITLSAPMTFNPKQQPIKLPTREVHDGDKALFSGWGQTEKKNATFNTLRKDILTVYSPRTCISKTGGEPFDDPSRFCTIDEKGKGTCQHDEGHPLVVNDELIGIASGIRWSDGCATGKMEFFVYIYECLDFILGVLDQETRKKMYDELEK